MQYQINSEKIKSMTLPEFVSNNESFLSGIAAIAVIIGFLWTIGRNIFGKTLGSNGDRKKTQKITLSELSSPSPHPIKFANSNGVNIAHTIHGQESPTLIVTPGIISNLHISSHLPPIRDTMNALASFSRVINFDKRGQGLSDPTNSVATLDERILDIHSVADQTNSEKFFLMGISEGGPMSIKFAVDNPERVRGLILFGTTAKFSRSEDYPLGISDKALDGLIDSWGTGAGRDIFFPSISRDVIDDETYRGFEKLLSDKRSMAQITTYMKELDVRPLLSKLKCPTLIIHFTGDLAVPIRMGRLLASHILNSEFVEIAGVDHCDLANAPLAISKIKNFVGE